jgi:SAM-dependent methyltransferase
LLDEFLRDGELGEWVKHWFPALVSFVRAGREARRRIRMRTTDRIRYLRSRLSGGDRAVIERGLFPALQDRSDLQRILFVGVEWYTRKYPSLFADREFWTLDIDPAVARYGARGRHIVDSITQVEQHFEPSSLDVIICFGVWGPWVHEPGEPERTYRNFYDLLRPGGLFILGWPDREDVIPVPPDAVQSLQRFERFVLPPFTAWRHPFFGEWRMMLDFYRRPEGDREPPPV